jgi:hypothetical protein
LLLNYVGMPNLLLFYYLGMRLLSAVLCAQQPFTLQQLAQLAALQSWQQARNLILRAPSLFILEHSNKNVYIRLLGSHQFNHVIKSKLSDHVLGSSEDQEYMACALSTVTLSHKLVYDWYSHFDCIYSIVSFFISGLF